VAAFLWWLERRKQYDGQVFLALVALHETGKFLLEYLREPELGSAPNWVPTMSFGAALLAAGTMVIAHLLRGRSVSSTPAYARRGT
jgi:prolipoprotein diacylglyceryltransferase